MATPFKMEMHLFCLAYVIFCISILKGSECHFPIRAAYWPAYAAQTYPLSKVNANLYTHLFYAFADLNGTTFTISPSTGDSGAISTFSKTLKSKNPWIYTLISIGGGGSDTNAFSAMARSANSRQIFINSTISLARKHCFDGLDLDWEFPQNSTDMQNLGALFSEWREMARRESKASGLPVLLITAAVYYAATVENVGGGTYPISSIKANVDFVNVMAFDYHGSWEPNTTGVHTAVFDPNSEVNTDSGITKWLNAGLPGSKAVMGLAMYGREWNLKNSSDHGIGSPAVGVPADSTPIFSSIVRFIKQKHASLVFDNTTLCSYCYSGTSWIGFDDRVSIAAKVGFLKSRGLQGYFFWTASYDDKKNTLSKTAAQALVGQNWRKMPKHARNLKCLS